MSGGAGAARRGDSSHAGKLFPMERLSPRLGQPCWGVGWPRALSPGHLRVKGSGTFLLCPSGYLPHGCPAQPPARSVHSPASSPGPWLSELCAFARSLGMSGLPTRMLRSVGTPTARAEPASRRCPLVTGRVRDELPGCTWTAGLCAIGDLLIPSPVAARRHPPPGNGLGRASGCSSGNLRTLGKPRGAGRGGGLPHLLWVLWGRRAALCSGLPQTEPHVFVLCRSWRPVRLPDPNG